MEEKRRVCSFFFQDSNGRRLFVNHTQRRASLRRPLQRQQLQPQQPQQHHATPVATGVQVVPGQEEVVLHHRRFLERNHSIDVIRDQPDDSEENSVTPPSPQEESVLHPLDYVVIGLSDLNIPQDGPSGTTPSAPPLQASATTSASVAASTGASVPGPSHAPQVQTALQRAVSGDLHVREGGWG